MIISVYHLFKPIIKFESYNILSILKKLKQRLNKEESQVVTNCHALKIKAIDGKMRET